MKKKTEKDSTKRDELAELLANELNTAISGQSLLVDMGWSIARKI